MLLSLSVGLSSNKNNKQTTHVEPIVKRLRTGVQLPPLPPKNHLKPSQDGFLNDLDSSQFYPLLASTNASASLWNRLSVENMMDIRGRRWDIQPLCTMSKPCNFQVKITSLPK